MDSTLLTSNRWSLHRVGQAVRSSASTLALCAAVSLTPLLAHAANTAGATIGAIRWDAWVGPLPTGPTGASTIGLEVERNLSHPGYHDRVPFYGAELSSTSVQVRETTQTSMDQDIGYARRAGLNYWAFCYFPDRDGMSTARKLYRSSSQKQGLKFTYVVGVTSIPTSTLISDMASGDWQTVLKGRPLLYVLLGGPTGEPGNDGEPQEYVRDYVQGVKTAANTAGLPEPYVVLMALDSTWVSARAAYSGADAVSSYADGGSGGEPYANIVSRSAARWEAHRTAAGVQQVVPWVTTGWDNGPRSHDPQSFAPNTTPAQFANAVVAQASPAAIGSFLQDAVTWVSNHQDNTDANTVLMYAWNELDEGGWLTPTLYKGTDRVAAVSQVVRYASSSNYDATPNYSADRAFDGDPSTAWQSAVATYNGQWLEHDFGRDMTFSAVTMNEYGGRTSGFKIQYMSGATWKDAYVGTTIQQNPSQTFTFPAVTGHKMRIYFTAGSGAPIIYEVATNATPTGAANLALNATYSSSSNWDANQTADKAFDGNLGTNWQATSVIGQWLQADFGVRKAFNTATMTEFGGRTGGYRIEYWTGAGWSTAHTGTTISNGSPVSFPTVVSDKVRIFWTAGSLAPIIYEMSVGLN